MASYAAEPAARGDQFHLDLVCLLPTDNLPNGLGMLAPPTEQQPGEITVAQECLPHDTLHNLYRPRSNQGSLRDSFSGCRAILQRHESCPADDGQAASRLPIHASALP
jgi:hypothetical protein